MADDAPVTPAKGDRYEHSDGTLEVVFAVEEGRVLTVREYPGGGSFDDALADATFTGTHEGVASLPAAEYFEDEDFAERE